MGETRLSVTEELVNAREAALTTLRHVERLMEYMGVLKSRTQPGSLHTDKVLESIRLDTGAATEQGE